MAVDLQHRSEIQDLICMSMSEDVIAAGTIGGTYATPLVNPPEIAIVALGKVRHLPRFAADGEVEKAALLNISWGADHRVLDGATLAEFSNRWKQHIEQPDRLLLRLT